MRDAVLPNVESAAKAGHYTVLGTLLLDNAPPEAKWGNWGPSRRAEAGLVWIRMRTTFVTDRGATLYGWLNTAKQLLNVPSQIPTYQELIIQGVCLQLLPRDPKAVDNIKLVPFMIARLVWRIRYLVQEQQQALQQAMQQQAILQAMQQQVMQQQAVQAGQAGGTFQGAAQPTSLAAGGVINSYALPPGAPSAMYGGPLPPASEGGLQGPHYPNKLTGMGLKRRAAAEAVEVEAGDSMPAR